MWYLCRKPCNLPSKDHSIISRTSIFSTSNLGYLEDISFIITDDENQTLFGNPWQWYAYECTPMQFVGVAVPRHTQIISVMPEYFLCARIVFPSSNDGLRSKHKVEKYAKLCSYSRQSSQLFDVQSCMELEEGYNRNLLTAACAILNGWLYVAGGYKAFTSSEAGEEPLAPLGSAERLNLATLQWEALPKMLKPEAYATGIAFRGQFYCIGGENHQHSAQIYYPKSNKWVLTKQFIPQEADGGYSVGSVGGRMILLTWSTFLGVKLWRYNVIPKEKKWTLVGFYADTKVARSWLDCQGPKLVRIKKQLFIMTGVDDNFCWVDGLSAWPTLPGPSFHMCDEGKLSKNGFISAVKFTVTNAHSWDCYPVYRIENAL